MASPPLQSPPLSLSSYAATIGSDQQDLCEALQGACVQKAGRSTGQMWADMVDTPLDSLESQDNASVTAEASQQSVDVNTATAVAACSSGCKEDPFEADVWRGGVNLHGSNFGDLLSQQIWVPEKS